jgi:hypothetical protein
MRSSGLRDRVFVEGVLEDLKHGQAPNIFEELGWKAEWEHNRENLVWRVLIGASLTSAAMAYLRNKKG